MAVLAVLCAYLDTPRFALKVNGIGQLFCFACVSLRLFTFGFVSWLPIWCDSGPPGKFRLPYCFFCTIYISHQKILTTVDISVELFPD